MSAVETKRMSNSTDRSELLSRPVGRAQTLGVAASAVGGVILTLTFVISAIAPPAWAVGVIPQIYILASVLFYCGVAIRTDVGAISLLVSLFFLFFVAIPAALQIDAGQYPFGGSYDSSQLISAYTVLSLGQLSVMLGMEIGRRKKRPPDGNSAFDAGRLARCGYILATISAAIIAYIGVSYAVRSRVAASSDPNSEGLRMQVLLTGRSLSLVAALILVLVLLAEPSKRRRPSFLLALIFTAVVYAILNFPSSLPRFQLLGGVLAFGCILTPTFKALPKIIYSVAAPGFLFFLFPAIKTLGSGDGIDFGDGFARNVHAYILGVDFDSFKQTMDTIIYVHLYGGRAGENLIGAALFWVPRTVWHGKPTQSGAIVSSALGYSYTNVSSPLPAEGLIAFGIIGTSLLCLFAGLLAGRVEAMARASFSSTGANPWILAYALATGFTVILLRGALNAVFPMIGPGIFACGIVLAVARTRGRPA